MTAPALPADLPNSVIPQIEGYARKVTAGEVVFFVALIAVVAAVTLGVMTWGVVALAMTALALVPVMLLVLVAITLG